MAENDAYIGYRSAGRRPERNNDREGAKGAPLAAIRGWIAGTAGIPGDIAQLARMIPGADRVVPDLPTSDFYKEWLPLRGDSAVERAFTDAGSMAGGIGADRVVRGASKASRAAAEGALSALSKAASNAAVPRTMSPQAGAIVWHGSPHKFSKFDSSKIGTGEGAQAYGHGLYLAESPGVAKNYAVKGASGGSMPTPPIPSDFIFDSQRFFKEGGQLYKQVGRDVMPIDKTEYGSALRFAQDKFQKANNAGSLYKVDLPDEHIAKMLDWDKPLSEQTPEVQKALAANPNYQKYWLPHVEARVSAGENPIGSDLHRYLSDDYGPDEVADLLKSQGIPGIRYLDGGSRGTGQGTSNFVVFPGNEDLLTILERNSKPVTDGYSHGGPVNAHEYDPDRVDALVQALEAGFEQ